MRPAGFRSTSTRKVPVQRTRKRFWSMLKSIRVSSPSDRAWATVLAAACGSMLVTVGLLVLTLIAGFFGSQNPYQNIAPTLVWIIFWVGLAVFSAFFGNLWALINPWRTLFDAAERVCRTIAGRGLALRRPYPR